MIVYTAYSCGEKEVTGAAYVVAEDNEIPVMPRPAYTFDFTLATDEERNSPYFDYPSFDGGVMWTWDANRDWRARWRELIKATKYWRMTSKAPEIVKEVFASGDRVPETEWF